MLLKYFETLFQFSNLTNAAAQLNLKEVFGFNIFRSPQMDSFKRNILCTCTLGPWEYALYYLESCSLDNQWLTNPKSCSNANQCYQKLSKSQKHLVYGTAWEGNYLELMVIRLINVLENARYGYIGLVTIRSTASWNSWTNIISISEENINTDDC